jgi:hypothetical protein
MRVCAAGCAAVRTEPHSVLFREPPGRSSRRRPPRMSQTFAAVARHRRSRPSAESRRTEKPGSAGLETAAPRRCRRDRRARQPPRAGTQPTPEPRPRSVGLPTSRPPAGAANAPRAAGQDSRPWRLPSIGSSERTCLDDGVAVVRLAMGRSERCASLTAGRTWATGGAPATAPVDSQRPAVVGRLGPDGGRGCPRGSHSSRSGWSGPCGGAR